MRGAPMTDVDPMGALHREVRMGWQGEKVANGGFQFGAVALDEEHVVTLLLTNATTETRSGMQRIGGDDDTCTGRLTPNTAFSQCSRNLAQWAMPLTVFSPASLANRISTVAAS